MAHPYYHSVSSARQFGGKPDDYQQIHNWFDATKIIAADNRHRAFRHHREGVAYAESILGSWIKNSDGINVSVNALGEQHCREDFGGYYPSFSEWIDTMTTADFVMSQSRHGLLSIQKGESASEMCARRFGGRADEYCDLIAFMNWHVDEYDLRTLMLRHHSMGIFDLESSFGVTTLIGGKRVPIRVVGEAIISKRLYPKLIPKASDWIRYIGSPPWKKQPLRIDL